METSRPFPGTTLGHAGPYSVRDWWDCWGAILRSGVDFGLAANRNIGVFYAIANNLEPTINGANIDVDTGASAVDGLYHENDATVTVPIPVIAPNANPRIDYIIVRKNYQAAVTYTPAGGGPTVPPRETHITVLRGVEGAPPAAPTLTQDTTSTTYWDIPIATIDVAVGGALSNLTDMREFVDAETIEIYAPFISGRDITVPTDRILTLQGVLLVDTSDTTAYTSFRVPTNFIKDMNVTPLIITDPGVANNDVVYDFDVNYGACDEGRGQHSTSTGDITIATTGNEIRRCLTTLTSSLALAALGDVMNVDLERVGTAVADNYVGNIWATGIVIEYFGWKK